MTSSHSSLSQDIKICIIRCFLTFFHLSFTFICRFLALSHIARVCVITLLSSWFLSIIIDSSAWIFEWDIVLMIFLLEITSLRLSIYLHCSTTEVSDTDVLFDSSSCVFFFVSQISLRWLFFKTHWIISLLNSVVLKSLAFFLFLLIIVSSLLSWSAILSWYWLRTFSLQNSDFSLDALHNQWKKCLISRDDDSNVSHICLVTLTEIASQL